MIDDPLALIVQAVFVLAAGMYPVGFMFGVCSDCCGCQPCKCNHHFIADAVYGFGSANRFSLSNPELTVNATTAFPADGTLFGQGAGIVIVAGGVTYTNWELKLIDTEIFATQDECFCWLSASEQFNFRVLFYDNNFQNDAEARISARYDFGLDCEDSGGALVFDAQATSPDGQDFANFVTNLALSGSYSFDPCECGACCEGPGLDQAATCTNDVAEAACNSEFSSFHQDTACTDVDCSSGACCTPGGCVEVFAEAQCDWTYYDGVSCGPDPC